MAIDSLPELNDINQLLKQLDEYASKVESDTPPRIVLRSVGAEDVVDDSLPSEELWELDEPFLEEDRLYEVPEDEIFGFEAGNPGPVVAVDCGIVRLGETENGLVISLRAAIVTDGDLGSEVKLFRTGPLYLHNHYKQHILHQMGAQLGREDFFVELDTSDPETPVPMRVKRGVADDAHQYADRFRNWFERLLQKQAVAQIQNGVILFDGALTLRTRDTPSQYLEILAQLASSNGNAIVAISKQSRLEIQGRSIKFWLNDVPNVACCRRLTGHMRKESIARVLGNAYAARFSAFGPTFRVDVKPAQGQSDEEAISQFFGSVFLRAGYPDILVRAHVHSYFTSPDVIQLQAQAGARFELEPQAEIGLTGIFAPFGGRYK